MVEVLRSLNRNEAICIQGNLNQLQELHDVVAAFAKSCELQLTIDTHTNRLPAPYDEALSSIEFVKNAGLLRFSVLDNALIVSGTAENFLLFAENLPYDLAPDVEHYHCHFDRIGHESDFAADSLDTFLALHNTPPMGAT